MNIREPMGQAGVGYTITGNECEAASVRGRDRSTVESLSECAQGR